MKIIVNGEAVETGSPNLADLLAELGKGDAKVATSLNEAFVPKTLRETQALTDGDRVEIVAPRQGG
ncbi:sulfur carrier protein ThiS [uncultured Roseobacter sp.]|uniref:sulfur carrier protein ThiS n=1 Tax=uncultured Roseobacter sp. TaxID=114847 RepID=UPI002634E3CC|nr:sulfur carrier protein ThiS [uncultured Roseobacter sp.]